MNVIFKHWSKIAIFLLPIALIKLTGWYMAPSSVLAETAVPEAAETPTVAVQSAKVKVGKAQREARDYIDGQREEPFGATPMYYLTRAASTPAVEPTLTGRLRVNVSLIMDSARGAVALIDERPYRVGDRLPGDRWQITAIDSFRRLVEFTELETGMVETASVPAPSGQRRRD